MKQYRIVTSTKATQEYMWIHVQHVVGIQRFDCSKVLLHTTEWVSERANYLQSARTCTRWTTFWLIAPLCSHYLPLACWADVGMFSLRLKWSSPHSPTTALSCFARYPLAVQSTLSVRSDGALPNHLTVKDSRRCRWSGAPLSVQVRAKLQVEHTHTLL